jgi:hypothetical protein
VPPSPLLSSYVAYLKASSNVYEKQLAKALTKSVLNTPNDSPKDRPIDKGIDTKEKEKEKDISNPTGYLSAQKGADDKKNQGQLKIYPTCPQEKIVELYQKICCPPMPKIKTWEKAQQAQMVKQWRYIIDKIQDNSDIDDTFLKDHKSLFLEWWNDFFKYLTKSNWLMGKNKSNWTANLQWIIGNKGFPRILNGAYHTKTQHNQAQEWIESKKAEARRGL